MPAVPVPALVVVAADVVLAKGVCVHADLCSFVSLPASAVLVGDAIAAPTCVVARVLKEADWIACETLQYRPRCSLCELQAMGSLKHRSAASLIDPRWLLQVLGGSYRSIYLLQGSLDDLEWVGLTLLSSRLLAIDKVTFALWSFRRWELASFRGA